MRVTGELLMSVAVSWEVRETSGSRESHKLGSSTKAVVESIVFGGTSIVEHEVFQME